MPSGRPKGGTNKYWTAKEKEKILIECEEKGIGGTKAAREYGISRAQYFNWSKAYLENGIKGLENRKKPGNPLSKYSSKKNLSKEEQLEYEIMKLRIENERLKKGYIVEGDGQIKQFISLKDKNLK
jgi:transposase-like protein